MVRIVAGGWTSSSLLRLLLFVGVLATIAEVQARNHGASRQGIGGTRGNGHRNVVRREMELSEGVKKQGCTAVKDEGGGRPVVEQIVAPTGAVVLAITSSSTQGRAGGFSIVPLVNSVIATTTTPVSLTSCTAVEAPSRSTTSTTSSAPSSTSISGPTLSGFVTSKAIQRHHHLVESTIDSVPSIAPTPAPISSSSSPSPAQVVAPGSTSTTILSTSTQIVKANSGSGLSDQVGKAEASSVDFFDQSPGEMENNGLERGDKIVVTEFARTTFAHLEDGNTVIVVCQLEIIRTQTIDGKTTTNQQRLCNHNSSGNGDGSNFFSSSELSATDPGASATSSSSTLVASSTTLSTSSTNESVLASSIDSSTSVTDVFTTPDATTATTTSDTLSSPTDTSIATNTDSGVSDSSNLSTSDGIQLSSTAGPAATPTSSASSDAQAVPTDISNDPTTATDSSDSNAAASSSASEASVASSISAAGDNAGASGTAQAAFVLPGRQLSVLPIGLGVFAGVSVLALVIVGVVTYERKKYRKQFRQRKMAEQISVAAGFNVAYDDGMRDVRI